MKRFILTLITVVATASIAAAQNYIVVNSEKIFKSIDAYNTAIAELDRLAESYQTQVDAKFKSIETLYNNYMAQKSSMPVASQTAVENQILHNLPVGLRRGAPVQPDGGRCQGAQAQVRWGCRGPWVSGEEMGEAGSLRAPAMGTAGSQGMKA